MSDRHISTEDVFVRGLDAELKQVLDARPGTLAENLNTLLWRSVGGETSAEIEAKIEHSDRRLAEFDAELAELERARDEEQERNDALYRRRAELAENKPTDTDEYDDALDGLLDRLVDEGHPQRLSAGLDMVTETAAKFGTPPEELMADLRKRAIRTDRHVHPTNLRRITSKPEESWRNAPYADGLSIDEIDEYEVWSL